MGYVVELIFIIALMLFVMKVHTDLPRLIACQGICRELQTWIAVRGKVLSAAWSEGGLKETVDYEFQTADGESRQAQSVYVKHSSSNVNEAVVNGLFAPGTPGFSAGQTVGIFYDPSDPHRCVLGYDLLRIGVLQRKEFRLKSTKQMRIELFANAVLCLAILAAYVLIVHNFARNEQNIAPVPYLFVVGVSLLIGVLKKNACMKNLGNSIRF